jgi:hypothetical protein
MQVNVAPVNNDNTKTYVLEFKKTTDSTWTSISTSALTGYTGTLNAVRSASSANTWEVRASITDKVSTATKTATVVSKRVPINCGFSGTAVAIGKVAETADLFEVDLAAKFNKGISIGSVTLDTYFLNKFYPIGTIYHTVSTALDTAAKMATQFGGTWVAWGTGRVPVGIDTGNAAFDTIEETGGAPTHTLSVAEMPTHGHTVSTGNGQELSSGVGAVVGRMGVNPNTGSSAAASAKANDSGSGQAHNNLQPYITCYFWKRTA